MKALLAAAAAYAVVALYLAARGASRRRIVAILLSGAVVGPVLALLFSFRELARQPVELIALYAVVALVLSAAVMARDLILGAITPVGVVLLNVAVNMAPPVGALPLTLVWFVQDLPREWPMGRLVVAVTVLYLPSIAALWALHRGPASRKSRIVAAAFVCWVAIAMLATPAARALAVHPHTPMEWVMAGLGVWVAAHFTLLLVTVTFGVLGSEDRGGALAEMVRVDAMAPVHAAAIGIAFGIGCSWFATTALEPEVKASAMLAAALALAGLFASMAARWRLEWKPPTSGRPQKLALAALCGGSFAALAWVYAPSERFNGWRLPLPPFEVALDPEQLPTVIYRLERSAVPYWSEADGPRERLFVLQDYRGREPEPLRVPVMLDGPRPRGPRQ